MSIHEAKSQEEEERLHEEHVKYHQEKEVIISRIDNHHILNNTLTQNFTCLPSSYLQRQPLSLKFKGIIISKVLGQIFQKNSQSLFNHFIKVLRQQRVRKGKVRKAAVMKNIERRTMIVLLSTLNYVIQQHISKIIKQAYIILKGQPQ